MRSSRTTTSRASASAGHPAATAARHAAGHHHTGVAAFCQGGGVRVVGYGVLFDQAAADLNVVVIADAGLHLDVNVALRGGHLGGVGGAGAVLGDQDVPAPHHRPVGDGQGVLGAFHHDGDTGVHPRHQLAVVVDADGDGISGGAAAGGAVGRNIGHHA